MNIRQGSVVKKSPSQVEPSHRVTLSEAKGRSRWAERSFASLRMTGLTLRWAERSFASLRMTGLTLRCEPALERSEGMTGLTLSVGEERPRSFEPCLNFLSGIPLSVPYAL